MDLTETCNKTDYKGSGRLNDIASGFTEFCCLKFESLNWEHYLEDRSNKWVPAYYQVVSCSKRIIRRNRVGDMFCICLRIISKLKSKMKQTKWKQKGNRTSRKKVKDEQKCEYKMKLLYFYSFLVIFEPICLWLCSTLFSSTLKHP